MVATVAAGTTAAYYTALADYYSGGSEPQGKWLRMGLENEAGANDFVDSRLFAQLHSGCDAEGRPMLSNSGGKGERVGGYDVTFSAPKSISVIWGLADADLRGAIERAQENAVQTALAMLEGNAAFCRSGKGGSQREPVRLTVAAFQHGGARPETHADGAVFSDPNLHTHAVVLNLGLKAGGRFGALDGKALFAWKMAAGATYHAALAKEIGDLGFAVEVTGKNGIFEVAGLDHELARYFSARRHTIEEELSNAGVVSSQVPAFAAAVARATRKQKRDMEGDDRFENWREHAETLGHRPDLFIDGMKDVGRQQREVTPETRARAIQGRIDEVLRALTEHDSFFQRQHLHAALAASLVGLGIGPEGVGGEIDACLGSGKLVMLAPDRWGHAIMTTPEMLSIERDIGAIALRLQGAPADRPLSGMEQRAADAGLSEEQTAVVRAATRGQAITIVEGAPGSGKTTTLRPIKDGYEAAGFRVVGSATAWRIANMLADDLGIEARATDAWLTRRAYGLPFLDSRNVLIVDEAGLLSSRQMHQLLLAVEAAKDVQGNAPRLVLVGDRDQLQSVGAGSGLGLIADALSTQRVETIQRQREAWMRDAILLLGKGEAAEALEAFARHGTLHERDGAAPTVQAMVDAWAAVGDAPSAALDTLLLAKTNLQVRAINTEVRRRLRAGRTIRGEDVVVPAVTRSGHGTTLPLAAGDQITFLARFTLDNREVINGTQATIEQISLFADGSVRIAATVEGRRIVFSPQDVADDLGRARLAHAYAATIHGAQGLTSERSLVLLTPEMDRHDAYVAASRARGRTDFFIDRKTLDAAARSELPLNRRAEAIDELARRSHLAGRLGRAGTKLTTLDVMAAAAELPREARPPAGHEKARTLGRKGSLGLE